MRTLLRLLRVPAVVAAALLVGAGPARAQLLAAKVNGAPITNEQLDRAFDGVLRERKLQLTRMQNPALVRDLKREALDGLIREELFWQQAQKEGLVATDAEVDKGYRDSAARYGSPDAFKLQLVRLGTDEAQYRAGIRRLLSADRYAQRVVEQKAAVSDAEIEAFYHANPRLFEAPERVLVRTIAISAPAGAAPDERGAARLRADALRRELAQGGDFDRLARMNSDDPTRQWGGALDPTPPSALPDWMQAPVARLKPGELSPVIETSGGYHLLRLDSRVPARTVPLAEARQGVYDHLRDTRAKAALDQAAAELRAAARVEILMQF